jgi:hypothetical protein
MRFTTVVMLASAMIDGFGVLTNLLFALVKPTVLAAEFACGLCWRGRKIEPRNDPDETSQHAL